MVLRIAFLLERGGGGETTRGWRTVVSKGRPAPPHLLCTLSSLGHSETHHTAATVRSSGNTTRHEGTRGRTVVRDLDGLRQLRNVDLKLLLHVLKHLLVVLRRHEADREPLRAKTTSAADTVQVRVLVPREVVVDNDVDTLDVNTASKHVGRDQNAVVELLEVLEPLDAAERARRG